MTIPIEREIYTKADTIANILISSVDNTRFICTDDNTWLWKFDGNIYKSAVSLIYDGNKWLLNDVEFSIVNVLKLVDSFIIAGIAIGESGHSLLTNFIAVSIVGALNEIKSESAYGEWNKVDIKKEIVYNIAKQYGTKETYIHVSSGLIDADVDYNSTLTIGQSGDTVLDSWYEKQSIYGCFNQLVNKKVGICMVNMLKINQDIPAKETTIIIFENVIKDVNFQYNPLNGLFTSKFTCLYLVTVNLLLFLIRETSITLSIHSMFGTFAEKTVILPYTGRHVGINIASLVQGYSNYTEPIYITIYTTEVLSITPDIATNLSLQQLN